MGENGKEREEGVSFEKGKEKLGGKEVNLGMTGM